MNPLFGVIQAIHSSLRYKLLALVLFPILLMMPIALGLAIYWGSQFSYDQLFIKVNTDPRLLKIIFIVSRKII
ncbi:MAG: hypothetical protein KZQ78_16765 [Candidatus Thiodiazotropha sp. (ex Ustalcina ferruginea)]|nr:hypothetical protein [Candidatus Thiodiazotropha sp. (ex Ustalcina ferruginea)]